MRDILKSEIRKYNQAEVAAEIETSSASITKFLNGSQETSLYKTLNLVRYLKPEVEKKMMIHFIKEVEKPSNIIIALEYCSTNRLIKTLTYLLNKFSSTSNAELKEYLSIYELILNWQLRHDGTSVDDQIKKARMLRVSSLEGSILVKMLEVYGYFNKSNYNLAYDLASDLNELVNELDNEYLKLSIKARLAETQGLLSLILHNDINKARQCAMYTIKSKIGKSFSAFSHYVLAASYFYQDYNKAKKYYEKAINIYQSYSQVNAFEVVKELEYLNAYNGEKYNYTNQIALAMYQFKQCKQMEMYNSPVNAIETMFIGEIKQDVNLLTKAFTMFINEKDIFNANHVKQTLSNMKVDTTIFDNLINIYA